VLPITDAVVLAVVILARLLVPLAIIRFPLPGILAAMVIDAVDQTVFQTFTSLDLSWYQGYDKALDVYYLAIAYIATLRNWTNRYGFKISRFLWYYRLVGVALFEFSQVRALLLIFPNTFEYFFDFVEGVRVRWDTRRMAPPLLLGAAAFIWIFIKLPQEWWIHIGQLDTTDVVQQYVFGVAPGTPWAETFAARPWVVVLFLAGVVALIALAWWVITRKLPPADRRPTFDADAEPGREVDPAALAAARASMYGRILSRTLVEKVVLLTLMLSIFGHVMPGLEVQPVPFAVGVALFVVLNAALTGWIARSGVSISNVVLRFVAAYVLNLALLAVMGWLLGVLSGGRIELQHGGFMLLLISLLITLYDRYRPEFEARFALAGAGRGA
jgi:hypothetical protein